jgi:hypothetical protein
LPCTHWLSLFRLRIQWSCPSLSLSPSLLLPLSVPEQEFLLMQFHIPKCVCVRVFKTGREVPSSFFSFSFCVFFFPTFVSSSS